MTTSYTKVLVVTSVYPLAETTDRYGSFVHEVIQQVRSPQYKFSVFAPAYKGNKHQRLEGVSVYRFRYCIKPFEILTHHGDGAPTKVTQSPLFILLSALYILLGGLQLFIHCWRIRPDVLHINWPFPHALMAYPAHKLLKIPMVFTFHGAGLLLGNKFGFINSLLKWLIPQAESITANSSFTRNLIHQLTNTPVKIIPYGLTIKAKPVWNPLPNNPPRVLYVGRLLERKGIRYLIDAMPKVLSEQKAELRIVGDGDLRQTLENQALALGLSQNIKFLGFVTNEKLVEEYANCDVFVLPAIEDQKGDTEGLGIVMIEALAHQKPVVASKVGGIVDVVKHNQTGLLVAQKDSQALAKAICQILENPDYGQMLGEQGMHDVQTRFGWESLSGKWKQIFSQARHGQQDQNVQTAVQSRETC